MKKALKITLITAAALAGTAVILRFTLGGLPFLLQAKKNYPETDTVIAEPYPDDGRETPADWKPLTLYEWTVYAPAELECVWKEGDSEIRKRLYTAEYGENKRVQVVLQPRDEFGELDLVTLAADAGKDERVAKEMLTDYCESLGRPVTDWYTLYDFIYHLRFSDCSITSLKKGLAFFVFSYIKSEAAWLLDTWEFHTENADGFVLNAPSHEDSVMPFGEIVELFPKSDRNTVYTLHIKASDEDTLHKMVHSVQLDPSKAFILQKQTDEDAS